ncbi:MerR family DNA-binding transcriptional regulator [Micromonospora avicenniae]|uniref:MerR family DNA-binding transcriptional regulator n=1 Tax=Micromonospora avicenniae TaxID=1198245 RepID=UPI00332D7308
MKHDTSFDWHEPGLTIGQVAQRSGVAASAIRFYEAQGLISSDRTAGNQRRYHGDVMCRLAMIEACQRVGLTLAEVGQVLGALPRGRRRPGRTGTRSPSSCAPRPSPASTNSARCCATLPLTIRERGVACKISAPAGAVGILIWHPSVSRGGGEG